MQVTRTGRHRARWRALSINCACAWLGASTLRAQAITLPRPTGQYAVGTTDWFVVDSTRRDTLDDVVTPRRLMVAVWYPAAAGASGQRAPYLRSGAAEFRVIAQLTRRPDSIYAPLVSARAHAIINARAGGRGALPIILLSHGYLSSPSVHTVVAEDLASHGYVVLAIAHTGEAQAVRFPNGEVVTMAGRGGGIAARPAAVTGEWGREDSAMVAVTSARTDSARAAIMQRYLHSIPLSTIAVARWTADMGAVLDEAVRVARGRNSRNPLARRLDTLRVGAMGHSFGGVTAAEFCRVDRRCRASLNLDGIPQYGALLDSGATRPFLMMYSARPGRTGASDIIYRHSSAPYTSVVLASSLHLDLSDWPLYGPRIALGGVGPIQPATATRLTALVVREWFDQELRARPSALLNGDRREPGLTVTPAPH